MVPELRFPSRTNPPSSQNESLVQRHSSRPRSESYVRMCKEYDQQPNMKNKRRGPPRIQKEQARGVTDPDQLNGVEMELGCGVKSRLETRASIEKEEGRTADGVDGAQAGITAGIERSWTLCRGLVLGTTPIPGERLC